MKAVLVQSPGSADQLSLGEVSEPIMGDHQILIRVKACGVNRADILQREGKYPPPEGESSIMGLEVSGVVEQAGPDCTRFYPGDKVFALLAGGGYAEYVVVDERLAMPLPGTLSFEAAAGVAEVFLTAHQALSFVAGLQPHETVLIHAGASGVGTAAIQLAKIKGANSIITAGSDQKIEFCKALGANYGINYKEEPAFDQLVQEYTEGRGVDVILDPIGASYFRQNLNAVGMDGRWVVLALMGGTRLTEVSLVKILTKRITISGSTLRARSLDYKASLVGDFVAQFLHHFDNGSLKPVIDRVFHWREAAQAHRYMEQNRNTGKIVLNGM